jgi:hypothetical protein
MAKAGRPPKNIPLGSDAAGEPQNQEAMPNGDRLPLQAQPKQRKMQESPRNNPAVTSVVFAVVSTGARGKVDMVGLHEIPLLRRKLRMQDPSSELPKIMAEWPEGLSRSRPKTAIDLRAEYERLKGLYEFDKPNGRDGETVNVLADIYGTNLRQMVDAMRRIEQGWKQIESELQDDQQISDEQMEELVTLADPDYFLADNGSGEAQAWESFVPAGAGNVVEQ